MFLTPRHLRRYRQIVQTLIRHGLGALVSQTTLDKRLRLPPRLFGRPVAAPELTRGQHARLALEELGPAFIKLGQLLSTRPDLIPPDVIQELRQLQDNAPQLPWETIQACIEDELGKPVDQLFASYDPVPLAAASLAQVHAATLADGQEVVVKVQRPGIEPTIDIDLDILYDLANLLQEHTWLGEHYDLVEVAEDFAATLHNEMDFRREGRNADRFRQSFAGDPQLVIPRVYWEYTTRRVLVLERIYGIKIDDFAALDAAGYNRYHLALTCARLVIEQVMEHGFFHADPHPGNFFVMPGEKIGAVDFGKVGSLDAGDRSIIMRLYIAVVQQDTASMVDQLRRLRVAGPRTDEVALQRDLRRLIGQYRGMPLQDIRVNQLIDQVMPIVFRHRLRMPADLWLLGQTLVMMEGLGMRLAPDFDIFAVSQPYVRRFSRQMWMPSQWGPTAVRGLADWADLLTSFPRRAVRLLDQAEQGELQMRMNLTELPPAIQRMDRMANRLALSVLLAAFILALGGVIPSMDLTWPWPWITWIALTGFFAVSSLGMWLLWSIWRSGRS